MTVPSYPPLVTWSRALYLAAAAACVSAVFLVTTSVWLARNAVHDAIQRYALDDTVGYAVDHTIVEAQLAAMTVRSTLKDAETGQRGFLLTQDPSYLVPYDAARERLGQDLAQLDRASLGDAARQRHIDRVRELAAEKMAELARTVANAKSGRLAAALAEVRTNAGKEEMDAMRAEFVALQADADARLASFQANSRSVAPWAAMIGLGGLAVALMGGVAIVQRQATKQTAESLVRLDRFTRAFNLTQGIMLDLSGRIVFWSGGAERLYGYGKTEAIGRVVHDLLRTEFPQPLAEIEAAVLRDGHWTGELEHDHRDGSRIFVASNWALHRGEGGEADSIIKVDNDITALKETEADLRQSDLTLRLAIGASDQGIWQREIGAGNTELKMDARCRSLFGLTQDEPIDRDTCVGRMHADDRAMVEARIARALDPADANDTYDCEYRVFHPDGDVRWIRAFGRALFEPDPNAPARRRAIRFLGTMRDVSPAKCAEEQRERDAALLRTIVETVPGLIYAKDREGRMLVANRLVTDLIGKPWADVEGRTDAEFLDDGGQAKSVMRNDRWVMERGSSQTLEEPIRAPDGEMRLWLSTKTPLRGADAQTIGLVGLSIDITERKRTEDRMRLMINELNHRVKNTLATVQAIALRTLVDVDPQTRRALENRLLALAAAHDVLTRESWEGAGLTDVVQAGLIPFRAADRDCFRLSGPALYLCPRAALALAMGLHELATNALKYGALATLGGVVDINWYLTREATPKLRMTWTERGGPPVAPPTHRGFGIRLVERNLAQDLGGTVDIGFDNPEGIVCLIEAPLAEVTTSAVVTAFRRVGVI